MRDLLLLILTAPCQKRRLKIGWERLYNSSLGSEISKLVLKCRLNRDSRVRIRFFSKSQAQFRSHFQAPSRVPSNPSSYHPRAIALIPTSWSFLGFWSSQTRDLSTKLSPNSILTWMRRPNSDVPKAYSDLNAEALPKFWKPTQVPEKIPKHFLNLIYMLWTHHMIFHCGYDWMMDMICHCSYV